ncbi:uncharacterized protein Bfra_006954 [Botrytis fragariae]|uniref:Uncharacterized protein n=1 Tax=Botrytis fragariae TaxID=1964551 RepID=A0A8H6B679_9HELO|nr:uncharacterized protein Bfra_006954 [Botrytis fragariae]KAF5879747.1 hypothetical protein Bfra_006954 [Botrytis fragariae]
MAFSRAAIVRNLRNIRARPQFNQIARRTYASGGHGQAKSGGDAGCRSSSRYHPIMLVPDLKQTEPAHGHGGHGDSHAHEEHEEEKEEEVEEKKKTSQLNEEKTEEKTEDKEEPKESEKSEESDRTRHPATSDDEETVGETDKNVRKSIPDAKGGNKARSESKAAIKQGEDNSEAKEGEPSDKAAASKEPQGKNTQSGKQEGLSNTDTKHSTDITNDPTKSKRVKVLRDCQGQGHRRPKPSQPEEESDS